MESVISIVSVQAEQTPRVATATLATTAGSAAVREEPDTLELSPRAEAVARAVQQSTQRLARTAAIREEIASGTFERPERIEGTVDRLMDLLELDRVALREYLA